jgi:hypothetical protein
MKKIKRFAGLVMALLFIWLVSSAGNADYEEALRQERQYVEDVCSGFRPNWKDQQQVTCKED